MQMIEWITGARRGEIAKTVYSFLGVFFLLLSYYLVKPLRNSQFLNSFDPSVLPFFYLIVPVISLAVTKVFNYCCDFIPKYRLFVLTYLLLMACKLVFWVYLPVGGKAAMVIFYFWASVYFLLAVALIWSCINTIFSPTQGERSFGFVALGGTIGNILGAEVSSWIARSAFKDQALLISSLAMGAALGLLLLAIRTSEKQPRPTSQSEPQDLSATQKAQDNPELSEKVSSKGLEDLKEVWRNRYVRGIAIMVFALALFNTLMDFQSQKIIDSTYSQKTYASQFQWLKVPPAAGLALVDQLRQINGKEQAAVIATFLQTHKQASSLAPQLAQAFQAYTQQKEAEVRDFFSRTYKYHGILGAFLLLVISRPLFRYLGLRFSSLILPVFFLLAGVAFLFPLDLMLLQIVLVVGGALNYSLNNASKELLYTVTSEDIRFKLKPLIEGPIMRLGDVSASILKIVLGFLVVTLLKSPAHYVDWIALGLAMAVVAYWLFAIGYTGRKYDTTKSQRTESKTT